LQGALLFDKAREDKQGLPCLPDSNTVAYLIKSSQIVIPDAEKISVWEFALLVEIFVCSYLLLCEVGKTMEAAKNRHVF
jgi:hypothetical protein